MVAVSFGVVYLNYASTKWIRFIAETNLEDNTNLVNHTLNVTETKEFIPRNVINKQASINNIHVLSALGKVFTVKTSPTSMYSYSTTSSMKKITQQLNKTFNPLFTFTTTNVTTTASLTSIPDNSKKIDNLTTTQTTFKFPVLEKTLPTIHFDFTVAPHNYTRAPKKIIPRQLKTPSSTPLTLPPSISRTKVSRSEDRRYLVYVCDHRSWCGGMGDRQRALVSLYVISRLVNRQFYLHMTSPCSLDNFYIPKTYQWEPDWDEIGSLSQNNTITGSNIGEFTKALNDGDFNINYPQKVIYIKTNSDLFGSINRNSFYSKLLEKWNGLRDNRERFHWAWHELMQPSPKLLMNLEHVLGSRYLGRKGLMSPSQVKASKIKPLYDVGDSKLICAHVRMGQNPSLPKDNPFIAVHLNAIPKLHKFMLSKDIEGNAMFFVATDYINIRIRSHNMFGKRFIDYGAKIFHIDRQRSGNDVCEGFGDAILDQLILSLCDVLVICRSGYSIRAYFMSNITSPVYIIENDEINLFDGG